jgi:hypothetical protein
VQVDQEEPEHCMGKRLMQWARQHPMAQEPRLFHMSFEMTWNVFWNACVHRTKQVQLLLRDKTKVLVNTHMMQSMNKGNG